MGEGSGVGGLVSCQQVSEGIDGMRDPSRKGSAWHSWSWLLTPDLEQRDSGSAGVHGTGTAEDGVWKEDQGKLQWVEEMEGPNSMRIWSLPFQDQPSYPDLLHPQLPR